MKMTAAAGVALLLLGGSSRSPSSFRRAAGGLWIAGLPTDLAEELLGADVLATCPATQPHCSWSPVTGLTVTYSRTAGARVWLEVAEVAIQPSRAEWLVPGGGASVPFPQVSPAPGLPNWEDAVAAPGREGQRSVLAVQRVAGPTRIGVALRDDPEGVIVTLPDGWSPARTAGIRDDDHLVEVAGRDVRGSTAAEVAQRIAEEPSNPLPLGLERGDGVVSVQVHRYPSAIACYREWSDTAVDRVVSGPPEGARPVVCPSAALGLLDAEG